MTFAEHTKEIEALAAKLGVSIKEAEAAYQWILRAQKHLGEPGMTPEKALELGRREYEAFLTEMHEQRTTRAKLAAAAIARAVHIEVNVAKSVTQFVHDCNAIAREDPS